MSSAPATGIQQLTHDILALLARLNVGTAMRATTAGRMPRKIYQGYHGISTTKGEYANVKESLK